MYKKYKQHDERDCGAACLATIFSFFGLKLPLTECRELVKTSLMGSSIYGIVDGAKSKGLDAEAYEGNVEELINGLKNEEFKLPLIAHIINENGYEHFVIVTKINKNKLRIFDPGKGMLNLSIEFFSKIWTGHIVAFNKTNTFKEGDLYKGKFNKFFKTIFEQKKLVFLIFFFSLLIMCISLISSMANQIVIDRIITPNETISEEQEHKQNDEEHDHNEEASLGEFEKFIEGFEQLNDSMSQSKYVAWAFITLFITQALIQIGRGWLLAKVSQKIDISLMTSYTEKLHRLPPAFFHNYRTGEILSRFTDISEIRNALSGLALSLIFDTIIFIGGAIMMWMINFKLFCLMMIVAIFYLLVILFFKPFIEKINMKIMASNAITQANFKESIDGIETTRLNNSELYSIGKIKYNINTFTQNVYKGQIINTVQDSVVYLVESISIILTLIIGSQLVIAGQLSLGFLMTFSSLIGYIIMPIKQIIELQPSIQKAFVAADRLNDILDSKDEESSTNKKSNFLLGKIEFNNVNFRYNNDNLILEGLSFSVNPGEKIAIVGESGCGKTTISKLLMKLYYAENGEITINQKNIECIPHNEIRKSIAYIPQDTFLFSDTLLNNLTFGNKDISLEEVEKACRISQLSDLIASMPYGLDTIIDENGKNLSGGQKQRVAIARALLRHPQILIMDEATGQLDSETEYALHNALFKANTDITCIIISHRLSTLKRCDRIIVIDDGKVIENGTHDELLNARKKYYCMNKSSF